MAKPVQTKSGKWKIQVQVNGRREAATLPTRKEAELWAARRRLELAATTQGRAGEVYSLGEAFRKYAAEISPGHKGARWEQIRLAAFTRQQLPITLPLAQVTPQHIVHWRQQRLTKVGPSSVRREMSLLGSVFTAARREWGWIQNSPMADVRRPPDGPGRKVVLTKMQIKRMLRALGYRRQRPQTMRQVIAHMMLLGLRTGMRSGEMEGLTWDHVYDTYVHLPETKNGRARDVPLSRKARPIIARMHGWDDKRVFPISAQSRDALWRAARDKAGLEGFVFHDLRHTAATWIGRDVGRPGRLSFPQFVAVFGWRDPRMAVRYVNPDATELADLM